MARVVTALFLVPIAVYSALFAPWWFFFAVIAIVALLCFREYALISESFAPLGYVAGILILARARASTSPAHGPEHAGGNVPLAFGR